MSAARPPTGDDLGAALRRVVEALTALDVTTVHPIRRQPIVTAANDLTAALTAASRRRSPRGSRGARRGHGTPGGEAA